MTPTRPQWNTLSVLVAVTALVACGGDERPQAPEGSAPEPAAAAPIEEPPNAEAEASAAGSADTVEPEALNENGSVVIKEYQAAFIGSGTLGKGTLSYQGRQIPFRIGGLGFGGIGVAVIDARGSVYDMKSLDDFTGTYGNARLGATAADKGKGRLWLKNTKGVVLKLYTDMQGLALTGGVDGIVISWESDVQEGVRETKQGAKKAWEEVKQPFE